MGVEELICVCSERPRPGANSARDVIVISQTHHTRATIAVYNPSAASTCHDDTDIYSSSPAGGPDPPCKLASGVRTDGIDGNEALIRDAGTRRRH